MKNKWWEKLKVGDKVIIRKNHGSFIQRVERFTKTLIIIDDSSRFRRDTGIESGSTNWSWKCLEKATDKAIKEIENTLKKRILFKTIKDFDFGKLSLSNLEKLNKFIEELKNEY